MASRNTNLNMFNVALMQSKKIFGTGAREIVACVNGKDCYELWKTCFKDPIAAINKLEAEKKIEVDGKTYSITMYLGGDYKFLLTVTGMNAANAAYACVWCYAHKARVALVVRCVIFIFTWVKPSSRAYLQERYCQCRAEDASKPTMKRTFGEVKTMNRRATKKNGPATGTFTEVLSTDRAGKHGVDLGEVRPSSCDFPHMRSHHGVHSSDRSTIRSSTSRSSGSSRV